MSLSDKVHMGPLDSLEEDDDDILKESESFIAAHFPQHSLKESEPKSMSSISAALGYNTRDALEEPEEQDDIDDFIEDDTLDDRVTSLDSGDDIIDTSAQKESPIGKEDTGDSKSYGGFLSKQQIVLFAVLGVIVVILLVSMLFKMGSSPSQDEPAPGSQVVTDASLQTQQPQQVVYQYIEVPKQYPEYVEIPTDYYTDKMVVSKYTIMQDNNIVFYFIGIPENFKQKISFAVSATTYNQIANGAVILMDYKVLNIDGKDYLVDIITNIGGI